QGYAGADGLIRSSMSREEIRSILEKDLATVPQAVGLNNHMGSRATADRYLMDIILDFLREKNLFFLDSKTTSKSIAYELALQKKVPALSRHVFLDADENRRQVKERLNELLHYALKNGQAVGIGHPFPETLEALKLYREEAERLGLEPVKLSALLR
ncbi:MAG: divergent polysaccharide deacetylase family protein, partial [Candidatus Saccharicenans sp.]